MEEVVELAWDGIRNCEGLAGGLLPIDSPQPKVSGKEPVAGGMLLGMGLSVATSVILKSGSL
jgi:hypothetical protein